jgi:hypothetical protein
MKVTTLDVKFKTSEVLKALDKRTRVKLARQSLNKGTIYPESSKQAMKVEDHPFFGMNSRFDRSIARQIKNLRESRFEP